MYNANTLTTGSNSNGAPLARIKLWNYIYKKTCLNTTFREIFSQWWMNFVEELNAHPINTFNQIMICDLQNKLQYFLQPIANARFKESSCEVKDTTGHEKIIKTTKKTSKKAKNKSYMLLPNLAAFEKYFLSPPL